jgi:serine/threonine protein kinase
MINEDGYLSIIDFGFAKKIPFVSIENGVKNVKMKSYTLCGTPGTLPCTPH